MSVTNDREKLNCLRSLYELKAAGLLLYGRALGLSHNEAEDILQETFLAMIELSNLPDAPERYCFRCFRNKALNYKRNLWRRLRREFESKKWFEPSQDNFQLADKAVNALKQLPPDQQEVIVLKIWNKLTFDQIGELLNISPNTVAGRYRYGLNKLKTILNKTEYEELEAIRANFGIARAASTITRA